MGEAYMTICNSCGPQEHFHVGIGMQYYSLENVIDVIPRKTRDYIQKIIDGNEILNSKFYHGLYECPTCNTVFGRFYVKLKCADGQRFETKFRCPKCRGKLTEIDCSHSAPLSKEDYTCKECGRKTLLSGSPVLWD